MPTIAFGIVGMNYQPSTDIMWKIVNVPMPTISAAKFQVTVASPSVISSFTFSFFLSTSLLFELGNQVLPFSSNPTSVQTLYFTQLNPSNNLSITVFLAGVTMKNTGRINATTTITLGTPSIVNFALTFPITFDSANYQLTELTFSYIIFDRVGIASSNRVRTSAFLLNLKTILTYNFQAWAYDGLLFAGLSQITLSTRNNTFSLQYSRTAQLSTYFFDRNALAESLTYTFRTFQMTIF